MLQLIQRLALVPQLIDLEPNPLYGRDYGFDGFIRCENMEREEYRSRVMASLRKIRETQEEFIERAISVRIENKIHDLYVYGSSHSLSLFIRHIQNWIDEEKARSVGDNRFLGVLTGYDEAGNPLPHEHRSTRGWWDLELNVVFSNNVFVITTFKIAIKARLKEKTTLEYIKGIGDESS